MDILDKIFHILRIKEEDLCEKIDLEILLDNRCVWLENITNRKDVRNDLKCQNILISLTISDFDKGLESYTMSNKREGDISYSYDSVPENIKMEVKKLVKGRR